MMELFRYPVSMCAFKIRIIRSLVVKRFWQRRDYLMQTSELSITFFLLSTVTSVVIVFI